MSVDSSSALTAVESGSVDQSFAVGVLRKAQNQQKSQGAQLVQLIESSGPQMVKAPDGSISVRA
jgi:hypothetical protein